eukprot:Blabericola_migrator_1__5153@NODE_265_length_10621_cov_160_318363_g221_i0_p3_GENE_NODE_265_length_10621_cov_160_318363_g221_i0NODE_265_length_10621_cov_160_318363_g221_i0_p3_ORF_typecomplete_len415_score30_52Ala_racemase_C/PF00842_21/9_3e28Ala_racemase_N/PF01168_20/5_2e18Ala_racemase_N/PF01168_20/2_1e03Orn_Arg_deC_N/PF02784_16/0_015_NODE_265_length_10621_cov_160_318363_g221_i030734317
MATALVDLSSIVHNAKIMRRLTNGSKMYVAVSADAYGHGAVPISLELEEHVDGFAVGRPNEAFELRTAGNIMKPILVLSGCWTSADLRRLSREACDIVVHSELQIKLLEATYMDRPISVWVELDLGLNGTGFRHDKAEAYQRLTLCPNVRQPPNFISHLSSAATSKGNIVTANEIDEFDTFVTDKPGLRCLADASSVCLYPEANRDVVRIGKPIYGICPVPGTGCIPYKESLFKSLERPPVCRINLKDRGVSTSLHLSGAGSSAFTKSQHVNTGWRCLGLKPVMTLKARLLAIRPCKQGEPIGVLGWQRASRDTKLGVVSIGFGDGYPSKVPEDTPMFINGRLCPIIDQPTMDTTIIDLGDTSNDQVGDEVVCWGGRELPLELLAAHLNVAPHSLCCALTKRVTRLVISGSLLE